MTAQPRFVRIRAIVEENYGDSIHIKAVAETDEGGIVTLPTIRYGTVAGVEINRANAYDELFAKIYARVSHADVEAAKQASKLAATESAQQIPVVLDDELREQALLNRRVVHDPDHIERMAANATPARADEVDEDFETKTPIPK